jgi:small GTP-binding protein
MGGKEISHVDSQYFQQVSFHLNILVCGDYSEFNIEKELENIKKVDEYKGLSYVKTGNHKNIPEWNFYLFKKDIDIGKNTSEFIYEKITKKIDRKNVILFYSGLTFFTYQNLIEYYDKLPKINHADIIIVTKKNETFRISNLKKLNINRIKNASEDDEMNIYIHLIEVSSYVNQLGDEIGFPKTLIKEELLEKDSELMIKHLFTFNLLVCGRPGAGKSTLINKILGKEKCYATTGESSLTQRIVKYVSEKYPILIYDTPGFEKKQDIERVQKLIEEKNKTLNEEKNRIHIVFYVLNIRSERTFSKDEYSFITSLLNQNMDIFIISTHAGTKENAIDFIEATKVNLLQNANQDCRIENLEKHIYPVELISDEYYQKFGLKEIFSALYDKYKDYKNNVSISSQNIKQIKSHFIGEISSKQKVITRLTALSRRVKANFKILASSLENSPWVKGTTSLSTAVIKIISKIYNHPISTQECVDFIEDKKYTNEFKNSDTNERIIEKTLAYIFYVNGPAAKQVDYLSECLIKKYNQELNNDRKYYDYLNSFNKAINIAIDNLKEITD